MLVTSDQQENSQIDQESEQHVIRHSSADPPMKRIHCEEQCRSQGHDFSVKAFCDQEGDKHGCSSQESIEKLGGPNRRSAGQ